MACKTLFPSFFLTESPRTFGSAPCFNLSLSPASIPLPGCFPATKYLGFGCHSLPAGRNFLYGRGTRINCSHVDESDQDPPQEAVLKAISEVSRTEGRVGKATHVIMGGTVADESAKEWLKLDQKVNTYPTDRGFTAIGTGGNDFVQSMVVAVESVIERPIPKDCVRQTLSKKGKYVSVNIGPVRVSCSEQVQAVYSAMRRDERMKYFL